jgi:hypothetical protein
MFRTFLSFLVHGSVFCLHCQTFFRAEDLINQILHEADVAEEIELIVQHDHEYFGRDILGVEPLKVCYRPIW